MGGAVAITRTELDAAGLPPCAAEFDQAENIRARLRSNKLADSAWENREAIADARCADRAWCVASPETIASTATRSWATVNHSCRAYKYSEQAAVYSPRTGACSRKVLAGGVRSSRRQVRRETAPCGAAKADAPLGFPPTNLSPSRVTSCQPAAHAVRRRVVSGSVAPTRVRTWCGRRRPAQSRASAFAGPLREVRIGAPAGSHRWGRERDPGRGGASRDGRIQFIALLRRQRGTEA